MSDEDEEYLENDGYYGGSDSDFVQEPAECYVEEDSEVSGSEKEESSENAPEVEYSSSNPYNQQQHYYSSDNAYGQPPLYGQFQTYGRYNDDQPPSYNQSYEDPQTYGSNNFYSQPQPYGCPQYSNFNPTSYQSNNVDDQWSGIQNMNLNDQSEKVFYSSHQYEDSDAVSTPSLGFNNLIKNALENFGGGSMHDIINTISNISNGQSGLTNMLASGRLEAVASEMIANAAHRFLGINSETGRIIGAIAGNIIFQLGGKNNSLSGIGKIILDNIISGKYTRKINPFVPPTPGMPSFNLNFYAERDRCLREHCLFEDPEFPAADCSLYFSHPCKKDIEWKRPGQIVQDPQLIVSKQSRFDVVQGALGDCWLLAATANLTLCDELFYRVVPPDQSFTENYAGIFHIQFWRYGKWVDVVIDDRLPTRNGELIYMHSVQHNEFWSALLEKAYAKLYGNYETLKGGSTSEAMEDFTGGLIEHFDLREAPREQLLTLLARGFLMGSLFGCSIDADPNVTEARQSNGLVRGHAYSITSLQTVNSLDGETVLLRIRNPWGKHEWNGPWSDSSPEWNCVSAEQRQALKVSFLEDGEFWMSFDDFLCEFERLEICNLGPDVMNEITEMTGISKMPKSTWTNFSADGSWLSAHKTAGGCRNNDTFANNPQYSTMFTITENSGEQDGKVTVIVAVLQKYRRELRVKNLDSLPIGFAVFRMDESRGGGYNANPYGGPAYSSGKLDKSFFRSAETVAKSPSFIDLREVTARFRVFPGSYVIVPSTFDPNEDAEFLLRVFTSGQISATELR